MKARYAMTALFSILAITTLPTSDVNAQTKTSQCADMLAEVASILREDKNLFYSFDKIPEYQAWASECHRRDHITKSGPICMDTVRGWLHDAAGGRDTTYWEQQYEVICGRLLE